MNKACGILVTAALVATFTCCQITRNILYDSFFNNFNGAGYFKTMKPEDSDGADAQSSLDIENGFDTVLFLKVKLFDTSPKYAIWEEVKGAVEVHFGLSDQFIKSHKEVKEDVYYRGDYARYYKSYVYGSWKDSPYGKCFTGVAVVAVKSEIGTVYMRDVYLRFRNDSWMVFPLDKYCRLSAGKINYLGTLDISLEKGLNLGQFAGRYTLRTTKADLLSDAGYFESHFKNLYGAMGRNFVYYNWE